MVGRRPHSTLTDTLFPSTPRFRSPDLASNSSTFDGSNCSVRVSPTCGATSGARRQQTLVSLRLTNTRVSGPVGSVTWTSARMVGKPLARSEEHTSELQSLMRISYAVFCLKKKHKTTKQHKTQ